MKLYYAKGACSVSCDILFREAALEMELEKVDLKTHTTEIGVDYMQINPKGYVPALVLDSGEVLTEAGVVLSYIADQKPEESLMALMPKAGTLDRYRAEEWLTFVATELHKGFGPYHKQDSSGEEKEAAKKQLLKRAEYIDMMLEGKDYLIEDSFMAPDAYAFAILRWFSEFDIDLSHLEQVTDYMERIKARPQVQEVYRFEGLE